MFLFGKIMLMNEIFDKAMIKSMFIYNASITVRNIERTNAST